MPDSEQTLLDFPCQFPIKAMGLAQATLETTVMEIIQRHAPETSDVAVSKRLSANGKYVSITITIEARSRAQLDAIYQELSTNKMILMAL